MCGINGFIGPGPSPVSAMNAATTHRGPDYQGVFDDATVHLGHCLLSIRGNPDESRQPYHKPGSPWVITFNGQIYNTRALAQKFSIPVRDLDTAMLADLLDTIGWKCIEEIQGMFALGVYNTEERVLRLYRDEAGQKPLYYASRAGKFFFSSEIKALIAAGIPAAVDHDALMLAGALGYIPGTKTLFAGIEKLDAGGMLTIDASGTVTKGTYTSNAREYLSGDPSDTIARVVADHLQSKQKVALNLSGGMDSSVLLHEMHHAGHTLTTYTTAFADAGESFNDDAVIAKRLAKDYGAHHTEILITPEIYRNNFIESFARIEEPNYNISLPTYLEVARHEGVHGDGNRVILSGNGGDEVFGGYPYYARSARYARLMSGVTPLVFNAYKAVRTGTWWHYENPIERWLAMKYFDFKAMPIDRGRVRAYLTSHVTLRNPAWGDPVRDMMLMDRMVWLPGESFMQADKIYMGDTLEVRAPLAYQPLRAYFDARLSTADYLNADGNKKLLRDLYRSKLPDYVVNRMQKTGWRSPVRPWYDQKFKELFLGIIDDAPQGGSIDWKRLRTEIERRDTWPGKYMFLYLSLAILGKKFNLPL